MLEDHVHGPDGHMVIEETTPAEAEVEAAAIVSDSAVEIARIEADKEIQLAKLQLKMVEPDLEAELAAARAELETLRAIVNPPAPEVEDSPAPVVVVDDSSSENDAEPVESLPEPDHVDQVPTEPKKPSHSMSSGWFG